MKNKGSVIISATGLTKKFGRVKALAGLDLEIHEGELFGLLGPNGAGKTTLISILSTTTAPTSGTASVCGYDVTTRQHDVRKSIGIVFQDPSLDDQLTGDENLDFHGRLYGMDGRTRRSRMQEVLALVDLLDRRKDLVKTYSGGMRRRLEIARGLMHRPRVLFLDEPTLGLDPQTRRRIWSYIEGLKESFGMTIILTTHYMDEADQLCSRVAIMDHGAFVASDSPQALRDSLGGDLLELETERPCPELVDALQTMEGVLHISVQDHTLSLAVPKGESFIPRCFELAQAMSVTISRVSLRKPNLEDVFIQLTGHDMRDSGTTKPKERMRIFMQGRR